MVGIATTSGTVIKAPSIRKVENHWPKTCRRSQEGYTIPYVWYGHWKVHIFVSFSECGWTGKQSWSLWHSLSCSFLPEGLAQCLALSGYPGKSCSFASPSFYSYWVSPSCTTWQRLLSIGLENYQSCTPSLTKSFFIAKAEQILPTMTSLLR